MHPKHQCWKKHRLPEGLLAETHGQNTQKDTGLLTATRAEAELPREGAVLPTRTQEPAAQTQSRWRTAQRGELAKYAKFREPNRHTKQDLATWTEVVHPQSRRLSVGLGVRTSVGSAARSGISDAAACLSVCPRSALMVPVHLVTLLDRRRIGLVLTLPYRDLKLPRAPCTLV